MTYEDAVQTIPCGRYRHFKGNEYEVIGIARHSEDESEKSRLRATTLRLLSGWRGVCLTSSPPVRRG